MANVNVPTDTKIKEKDVNQKLQLYGIYSAFANGKPPSSLIAIKEAVQRGSRASRRLKEVIKQAKHLLLSKNQGNLLQDFIWDCQNLDGGNASLPGAPTDKETAKQHGNEALDGLKTLGTLILSNGQFRKLLDDAIILVRDMAGDAASNAANKVRPDEERLNQIDQPAEDNTWHDVPDLSKDNIKGQVSSAYNKNKPFNREQAKDAAATGADQAQQQPTADNQQAAQTGASTTVGQLKDQARSNIPDETQEKARDAKNAAAQRSKNYLSKKMPQERREQSIWRLKKMIVEIQGHSDYQQAIETLLNLAETYAGHANTVAKDSHGTVKGAHTDNSLQSAEANLKTLIERFANSTSTDDLFDALNQIYRDAQQDPELRNWFKQVDAYIRKALRQQGFILQDQANDEWNALYDKGNFLLRERYRSHTDRLLDEVKFLSSQFEQDPQNRAFGDAVQKLFLDLGNDENGKSTFKPHLVKDVTEVIIPAIFENVRYVPIPRIEVSDPMVDVVVENLVLESNNLFPNVMEFGSDNYFRMGRRQVKNKHENKVMISASGIQCDLRDVAYYIKKKQGFPSITDKGVMDIILGGEGFSFKIAARNAQKSDRTKFIAVDNVDVQVKNLQVKIKQSNHKLLFGIAKPLLLKVMRPAIQKVIEKQIKDAFEKADAYLWSIHQESRKALEAAKNDPENAPNLYQSYVDAIKRKATEKKQKAEAKASNTDVNLAVTKNDSMFKHISLPGGISTKATEYQNLAAKGDRWESPVFSIGSAKESSDIPKLAQVTRKPHSTAQAGLRDHSSAGTGTTGGAGYGSTGGAGYNSGVGSAPGSGISGSGGAGQALGSQLDSAFQPNKPLGAISTTGAANTTSGNTGTYYDGVTKQQ
ncbi:uncharacterized protein AB675_1363 [Cyphellophora attinorum]|uniref:Uncharacterized protein n=1 Tax=Cyphellophora attinorum TaxID=1664694 RepID=A0A0N0NI00_9EURO|nr:uncharacterized protein AB675_1363 [Phialophora attinorum]KPI35148.1 hypothetical protein AB675_1363 [Phialophora attinorum]